MRRDRYGEQLDIDNGDQAATPTTAVADVLPFRRPEPAARAARLQLRRTAQTVPCRDCHAQPSHPCTRPGRNGTEPLEHIDHARRLRDALTVPAIAGPGARP